MKLNDRFFLKSILALFFLLLAQFAWSTNILKTPEPDWVAPVLMPDIDTLPQEKIRNGVYYRLVDNQVLVEQGREPQYYYHYADHIVNQTGVEGSSQLNLGYDPSYQRLRLHTLRVLRNNQVLDRIDSARMKLIQREEDMDNLIYSGHMTLNIILDDVRVGDTIEYSYSIEGMNPVFQNVFAYSHYLNWSVPVGRLSLRLLWHKPSSLQHQIKNSELALKQTETAQGKEYWISGDNVEPIKIESNTPSWFSPWGTVYFSELKSWQEVVQWGSKLYQGVTLADSHIKQLAADIKSKNTDIDAQISAALGFVQDEVRYLGIELGQNSHMPRAASTTFSNRYGDCKDKTVLLITLLKELGIKAFPALVDSDQTVNKTTLPSIHAFDHVITTIEHNNKRYWLDPTRSHQYGGIDNIHQPDYGYALVLDEATPDLIEMLPIQSKHGVITTDRFTLSSEEAILTSESKSYGWDAERQRRRFEGKGLDQMQQDYLEFYQRYYSGTEVVEAIKYEDNAQENTFLTTEHYRINDFWFDNTESQRYEADFYGNLIYSSLEIPDELTRKHPLYLSHPTYQEQIVELNFKVGDWTFDDGEIIEDNQFFYFSYSTVFDKPKHQLTLHYTYRSKADYVAPEDYADYLAALKKVSEYKNFGIYMFHPSRSASEEKQDSVDLYSYITPITVIIFYGVMYLFVILLWLIERPRQEKSADAIFYPVSLPKFLVMWAFTFGFYGMYWFYKNFQYIKQKENNATMPIARGIFCVFWYYGLWNKLKEDNDSRFSQPHLPNKFIAVLLALAFFVCSIVGEYFDLSAPAFACALLALPLANYILFVNGSNSPALIKNSKWRFRHYFLALLSTPLLLFALASDLGVIPSDAVIKGDRILGHNIKFMRRKGLINPGDKIDHFYSDALLFMNEDGNGFTQRHVFSYWKDDDGSFLQEQADYSDVKDIEVDWGVGFSAYTTVTIVRRDGSQFLLYLSNARDKDKVFVEALKSRWRATQRE